MREQKFRVWDKVDKRYYNNVDIEDIGRVLYLLNDYGHEYIIEQYTGLKDKNGKETYEGDIVQYYDLRYKSNDKCFGRPSVVDRFFGDTWDYEILGNIHENPELLGEEK